MLAIVAEQTGYPSDLLDLDLDLEADLGIDTVKQAEVFATIREAYGIERDDSLKLRDYPTLNHVVAFARERTPQAEPAEPAPVAPAPVAPAPVEPVAAGDGVEARVLAIVAEQTGYPSDLLDLDLDLEADLGIDTVKQAEVFAAIREAYGIERDDSLKLRDYPTLSHVVAFARDAHAARPNRAAGSAEPVAVDDAAQPAMASEARVLESSAAQTGYPADLLDLDLDLEADLGIDTVKQAEVFAAIREAYGIARDDSLKLRDYPTLNHVVGFVRDRTPQRRARPRPAPARAGRDARSGAMASRRACWRSWRRRPATRPTCSTWTSTWRPTSGSTRSSRPRCSPTIREAYGIERDDSLKLRDYPTLNHVVGFVARPHAAGRTGRPGDRGAGIRRAGTGALGVRGRSRGASRSPSCARRWTSASPPVSTLGEGSRVVLMPDDGGVGKALATRLAKLGVEVLAIDGAPDAEALEATLAEWTAAGPIHGVYWLPALDDEGPLGGLEPAEWRGGPARARQAPGRRDARAGRARQLPRHGHAPRRPPRLRRRRRHLGPRRRRDRLHQGARARAPRRARQGRRLRAEPQDRGARRPPGRRDAARPRRRRGRPRRRSALDGRPGRRGRRPRPRARARRTTRCSSSPARPAASSSAITADLAARPGGTFHLLDLVAEPDPADPDLARFATDRDGAQARARRAHPRARRAPDAQARRARARRHRARPRGARRHRRRSSAPAAPRTGTRSTSPTPTQVATSSSRRWPTADASTC